MRNIYIFTDIDGVLNTINRRDWNSSSIDLFDDLCNEFNLKVVVTSSWRVNHTKHELQRIFEYNGLTSEIFDYTPVLNLGRGEEIQSYLTENPCDDYLILDDNIRDIESVGLKNIVKCRSWLGFTEEEYNLCKNILK